MNLIPIKSLKYDSLFFFSPLFFVIIFIFILKIFFPDNLDIRLDPLWLFIFAIVFDVAHVWWSLYMVYFNKIAFNEHKKLYIITPIVAFIFSFLLVLYDISWTILFWLIWFFAVYHFIKQQVWFILLYWSKEQNLDKIDRVMDKTIWWTITWFPMLYWFSNLDTRNYIWFFDGEFIKLSESLFPFLWVVFILIVWFYILYEIFRVFTWKKVNFLKYFYIFITFFIWFNWIVWNNSLLIFAFWNILLHGLNYLGLTYLSTKNKIKSWNYRTFSFVSFFLKAGFLWFFLILFIVAIFEEYLWDQFFRQENLALWGWFLANYIDKIPDFIYAIIIWLLALPQLTHYYLDWYIWRKDFKSEV